MRISPDHNGAVHVANVNNFKWCIFNIPAYAHLGHVGELAGHAHWVGIGAVVVAGALAGIIGKFTENDAEQETGEQDSEEEMELGEEAPVKG